MKKFLRKFLGIKHDWEIFFDAQYQYLQNIESSNKEIAELKNEIERLENKIEFVAYYLGESVFVKISTPVMGYTNPVAPLQQGLYLVPKESEFHNGDIIIDEKIIKKLLKISKKI